MFKPIAIEVTNHYDFPLEKHPFSVGVPCAEGALFDQKNLRLDNNGQSEAFNITPLASWPDGSIKWFLLDFQTSIEAGEPLQLQLQCTDMAGRSADVSVARLQITDVDETYIVDTGAAQFIIGKQRPELFEQVVYDGKSLLAPASSRVLLHDAQGHPAELVVSSVYLDDIDNHLRKKISVDGFFQDEKGKNLADFNLKLIFFAGLATVKCEFTLTNSRAAEHPGGVWDLGDKSSLFFKALSLQLQLADSNDKQESFIRLEAEADWRRFNSKSLTLQQNSSGGENWQSKNHMDFKGEVPVKFKGYRCFEQNVEQASGDRATPTVHLTSPIGGLTAHVIDFWQNFPKALCVDSSMLSLDLFPSQETACYELQGGERKKHTFYLNFSNDKNALDGFVDEIVPRVPLAHYAASKVMPWLPAAYQDTVIHQLINRGIEGPHNFFEKREEIDEFGWRNFGEIFADHEQHEYKGHEELISHYNNQYDPVFGFIKQYLITGDKRWHELLSKLAQHVVDIDIYHTVNDRDEYNGGLFWHTHHYLSAFTCTHRTFSSKHAADFIYGEIGGGPGAEHCYTTGLSYYYYMTGDKAYKDAALQLVNWLSRVLEGSGTVIERVFQFKSKELPILKRLFSGERVQRYKYPFTRGTGNYISSLLDAYHLTGDRQYLSQVENVIQQSVHPHDDILLRNLEDTESSWSYLIYLQAICKYLDLKTNLQETDQACLYARDSLLHYVDWMLEYEKPFLEDSESLEYANHTWTAQDLRKANLFYVASLYSDERKLEYLKAAHLYVQFVESTLQNEETRHYSRILILLMQNDIQNSALDYEVAKKLRRLPVSEAYDSAPLYSSFGIFVVFLRDISVRLMRLSFAKEKRWLSFRM